MEGLSPLWDSYFRIASSNGISMKILEKMVSFCFVIYSNLLLWNHLDLTEVLSTNQEFNKCC